MKFSGRSWRSPQNPLLQPRHARTRLLCLSARCTMAIVAPSRKTTFFQRDRVNEADPAPPAWKPRRHRSGCGSLRRDRNPLRPPVRLRSRSRWTCPRQAPRKTRSRPVAAARPRPRDADGRSAPLPPSRRPTSRSFRADSQTETTGNCDRNSVIDGCSSNRRSGRASGETPANASPGSGVASAV